MSVAEVYAITGGSGYVGYRLALALLRQQPEVAVRLLDVRAPPSNSSTDDDASAPHQTPTSSLFPSHPSQLSASESRRLSFHPCDLTSAPSVLDALIGVTCVYHVASYGMSGAEMLDSARTAAVNVAGTAHVLSGCRLHQIPHLVYVSTYNVVYNGSRIVSGDESLPYPPLHSHTDTYSQTKVIAERMVLNASHDPLHPLRVCVIRPAAIYGDGEQRHLPRILRHVQRGLGIFAIGSEDVLCDWVYVDTLLHALILSQRRLKEDERQHLPISTQRLYFISDNRPTNNFRFLQLIIRPLHLPPTFLFYIPTNVMLRVAHCIEWSHAMVKTWGPKALHFAPFLTRAEVLKVGREHWMRVDRAKRELGWTVVVEREEAIRRCVEFYLKAGYGRGVNGGKEVVTGQMGRWWVMVRMWMGLVLCIVLLCWGMKLSPSRYR